MKEAIAALVTKVRQSGGDRLQPAIADHLKRAEEAGFPSELLEFYRECEPASCIELKQRIWSIDNALIENRDAVPGCALFRHGYVVFASTISGDSYCIDTNATTPDGRHPVALFSHEMIAEDAPQSDIQRLRLEVANSLEDFLVEFTNETLVDEPLYG